MSVERVRLRESPIVWTPIPKKPTKQNHRIGQHPPVAQCRHIEERGGVDPHDSPPDHRIDQVSEGIRRPPYGMFPSKTALWPEEEPPRDGKLALQVDSPP